MDFKENQLPPNPYERANPLSKLLFFWVFPLFSKGYNKDLEEQDLYAVLKQDETSKIGDSLERAWNVELERAKLTGKKPSLMRALFKISWKTFLVVTIVFFINQTVIM